MQWMNSAATLVHMTVILIQSWVGPSVGIDPKEV